MDGIEYEEAAVAETGAWYRRLVVGDVGRTSLDLQPGFYDAIIYADILEILVTLTNSFDRLALWFWPRCKKLLAYQFVAIAEPPE